ncbi:hypothetical protein TR80_009525 [Xanthomonas campestris]|uniref:hypothetical protein n=1 Tax=Xanthomonas campestris TaxID=339 RepID=UPI000CDA6E5B|nr:hypothetical protein [Xanthomonas campestris]TXD43087.1 hypothetical protein TR80_009525 [Xanthomonas campestris]
MSTDSALAYPEGADYALTEEEHDRLWRVQQAASLLAALNHDVATRAGVSYDGVSAVADFMREELLDIVCNAKRLTTATSPPRDADLI